MPQYDACAAFLWRNDTSNLQKPNLKRDAYGIVFSRVSDRKPVHHLRSVRIPCVKNNLSVSIK